MGRGGLGRVLRGGSRNSTLGCLAWSPHGAPELHAPGTDSLGWGAVCLLPPAQGCPGESPPRAPGSGVGGNCTCGLQRRPQVATLAPLGTRDSAPNTPSGTSVKRTTSPSRQSPDPRHPGRATCRSQGPLTAGDICKIFCCLSGLVIYVRALLNHSKIALKYHLPKVY